MSLSGDTKVFVGGLLPYTTDQSLVAYFGQFGEIVEAKIVMDRHTGRSKNYGFVRTRLELTIVCELCEYLNIKRKYLLIKFSFHYRVMLFTIFDAILFRTGFTWTTFHLFADVP